MKTKLSLFKKILSDFYLVIILIFLYAPIFTMMVLSFNTSKSRTQWGGFTLGWYSQMLSDPNILSALYNTLLIAFVSALIACILGTAAAIAINSMKPVSRTIVMGITNIPMLNADIVTGISLMLAFIAFGISLGFKTILIAHITFNIPYVILSVMPKLKQTDKSTYEAAMDLGASPIYAFFKVVFPDILPGVLSGFLLAFTMSLDDFIITHFTRGAGINTLSTLIYSQVRRGIQPSMYALSTVIFLAVLILLLITNYRPKQKKVLPGADSATIDKLEEYIRSLEPVTTMLAKGMTMEEICQKALFGFEMEILDEYQVKYVCTCSRDKVVQAFSTLKREDIVSLADETGYAEASCQYCGKKYRFSVEELEEIAKQASEKK